jgi:hypothetical protein
VNLKFNYQFILKDKLSFGGGNMIAFETNSETFNILFAIGPDVAPDIQVSIETIISILVWE